MDVKEKLVTYEEKLEAVQAELQQESQILTQYSTAVVREKKDLEKIQAEVDEKKNELQILISTIDSKRNDFKEEDDARSKAYFNQKEQIKKDLMEIKDLREGLAQKEKAIKDSEDQLDEKLAEITGRGKYWIAEAQRIENLQREVFNAQGANEARSQQLDGIQKSIEGQQKNLENDRRVISEEKADILDRSKKLKDDQFKIQEDRNELDKQAQANQKAILAIKVEQDKLKQITLDLAEEKRKAIPIIEDCEKKLIRLSEKQMDVDSGFLTIESERKRLARRELRLGKLIRERRINEKDVEDPE